MGVWRLEGKAQSLHGSALDPLPILWQLAWWFVGLLTAGVAMSPILLPVLETFPPILCLVQPLCGGFRLVYCILLCPVWQLSPGGLLFSEKETEGEWMWGTGRVERASKGGGRETTMVGLC